MSRIGRMPISIPAGVDVKIEEGNLVTVKGPKGTLTQQLCPAMTIKQEGAELHVTRPNDAKENRSLHGLTRSLLHNMVVGVTEGFKKELDVNGVGYRVAKEGSKLVMNLGFSHQVFMEEADGITIEVPSANKIVISGLDKQKVGQFAAEVREKRPPEPYKGKGIKYTDEVIRRKEGITYIAIDLKSFYASVECRERGLDPLDTNLVVADESRTDKTICLAVTPSLKSYGISGRGRLFEVLYSS